MKEQFLWVSGSASRDCSASYLVRAMQFIQALVNETLKAGGGLVVVPGDEEPTKGSDGIPRIFDWMILEAVASYVDKTLQQQRVCVRVILRDDAWNTKMSEGNQQTLGRLQQRGAVEVTRVPRERFTGGRYRQVACELADCMLALGGGKGTYSSGREMIDCGKPVLPIDLEIGAFSEDGEGALLLHKELRSNPQEFFPTTHDVFVSRIELLSLQAGEPTSVAERVIDVLTQELDAGGVVKPACGYRIGAEVDSMANKLLKVTGVLRAIEYLRNWMPWI